MKMGIALIVVGIVAIITGAILVAKGNGKGKEDVVVSMATKEAPSHELREEPKVNQPQQQVSQPAAIEAEKPTGEAVKQEEPKGAKEKGNDFEGFMADVLKANGIKITEWNQGTTSPGGAYGENCKNPDFKVEQPTSGNSIVYWVECKWRKRIGDEFSLEEYQINRYRKIQRESKRKVLIAIGVGGSPEAPQSFYVVPLDSMGDTSITKEAMRKHYMSDPKKFFAPRIEKWFMSEVFRKHHKQN